MLGPLCALCMHDQPSMARLLRCSAEKGASQYPGAIWDFDQVCTTRVVIVDFRWLQQTL
jgi:hypothetical protein